jgi:hypothetical protein
VKLIRITDPSRVHERLARGWSLGFTGSQNGMTPAQADVVEAMLRSFRDAEAAGRQAFNHGDNAGADCQAGALAYGMGYHVALHPPTDASKRGFGVNHETNVALPYLDRNRNVVNASMIVIATPEQAVERLRSGTWNTIRYARHYRRPLFIVCPDGSTTLEIHQRGDD